MKTQIDIADPLQTISGPFGVKLTLDAKEIFPDDPGMGTPLLLSYKGETMTLECATANACEMAGDDCSELWAERVYAWINFIYEQAGEWETYHVKLAMAKQS